ncbi:MAG: flagellar assembly protein FliW [Geothrix sp.]|jgi:flagellar assembly factor FliW|uniref:Flagellar assembly factor FliW n=1 Tax=Candidatus Geothrix odensensis TaxID=2954440 RepID=A0A936F168_9BACT|nr:flagellar assembly protein FliW [Holophagaceae bacterium]MBK8571905.1 flagellar assembly protein FliW [Candidatus Geothrix odensensis]MBK8791197.1 flagellar assembly protein FliW [Holophagaceae bacterium]MCC6512538.1 flagellar assembly protein FliW [Geothrix sp.]
MTPEPANTPHVTPENADGIPVTFPKGLLGFERLTAFTLFEPKDGYPLKFLQSNENAEVSFICIDPVTVKRDYQVPLTPEEAEALALEAPEDALILTLVVVPEDPRHMTTNLAGPLIINIRTRVGRQIILSSETYPLRCPILLQD